MINKSDIGLYAILIRCDFSIQQKVILANKYLLSFRLRSLVSEVVVELKTILFVENCQLARIACNYASLVESKINVVIFWRELYIYCIYHPISYRVFTPVFDVVFAHQNP